MNRLATFILLVCAALAGVLTANAQPVTTIYSFAEGPANPQAGLTLGNDGNFYGTTSGGGLNSDGTLFQLTTNGVMTILVNFNGYGNGSGPVADLLLGPDGNFYGTTSGGGTNIFVSNTNGVGTVFKVTTNGIVTVLVNFTGVNGGVPQAGLTLGPDGNFYGTTEFGGLNGDGTVFKMTTNGTLTTLVSFNGANGMNPPASLTLGPGGSLYGTTRYGGSGNAGTVFQVTTNGAFTTLLSFVGTNGLWPYGGVTVGPDGNLYGTTSEGSYPNNATTSGNIFELTTNGILTTLVRISGFFGASNSGNPHAGLTLGPDGNFYGTTYSGGANGNGSVFQVSTNGTLARLTQAGIPYQLAANSFGVLFAITNGGNLVEVFNGTLTTLHSFSALTNGLNPDGAQPQASLTLGPDGNLYGTAYGGGAGGFGTVFKVTTNGTFSTVASFTGNTGVNPESTLTPGPDGSLYGAAKSGGIGGRGTLFQLTTSGALTRLVNFDSANKGFDPQAGSVAEGANPQAGLIPGPGGNFYGTAVGGGTNLLDLGGNNFDVLSDGTVFELTTNGILTPLIDFNGTNGANPYGGLAVGNDGNLYGTTAYGGISNDGTIFQITTNGTLTTLTNFTGTNGANPQASLTLGPDGNFYGTCGAGGFNGDGTVFQVTTNGALTTLAYFNGTNGADPQAGLLLGLDGNFYGTTYEGGARNDGTVFKLTTSGTLTTLVNFAQTNGQFPIGGLALGPDGNFYGTTQLGGVGGAGTVFKLATNGTLTTIYGFVLIPFSPATPNGTFPFGALTLQTNGDFIHFYGTTYQGGSGAAGTVFQLNLTTAYAMTENTTNTFFPLTNEVMWTTGGVLGLVNAGATNGAAQVTGSGIGFTPRTNFTGTATINYAVTDNAGGTNVGFITILVTNIPPVANPDFYSVAENSSANVLTPLVNDLPVTSGGMLGLVLVRATNGTAVISGTNVLFTPSLNFMGTATIGYTMTDKIGGMNSSLITVNVSNPLTDLSLSASAVPEPVGVGSNLVYSLIVSNAGPSTASGVIISNQLPANVNFVSATGGSTPSSGILLVDLDSLAANATTNVQVIVQPAAAGKITNSFQIFAHEFDPNVTNNSAAVVSTVTNATVTALADLSLSASAAPEPVPTGSNLVYSITVSNVGPATATGVVVSNQLPANVNFVSATGAATPGSGVLLWNVGSLTNGAVTNVQVIVQPEAAGSLTNLFEVFANELDPNVTNNSVTVVSTVMNTLPVGWPGMPYAGSWTTNGIIGNPNEFDFTIGGGIGVQTYQAGFVNAQGGSATNAIPGDVVLLIDPNGGNNPTNWAAVERFFNPNDPAGSNGLAATEYQTFSPAEAGPGGFANFALFPNTAFFPSLFSRTANGITTFVASEPAFGPGGALLAGQEAIIVYNAAFQSSSPADLSLSASAAPEPVPTGSNLVYSITVSNVGPATATGVVISNQLPPNVNFVSATGAATPGSGVLLWNVGSLTNGAVTNVQVIVQPEAAGSLTNLFEVFANELDPNVTNNSVTVVSTVTNPLAGGSPGFPYAGSWTMYNQGSIGDFTFSIGGGIGVQSYAASFTDGIGGSATDAIPGDVILLIDPNGGNNPTNWAAVERFFNPNDPAGSNGLAATEYQTFSPAEAGPGGFANFALFPNTAFFPTVFSSTNNGITKLSAIETAFGPAANSLGAGQEATYVINAAFQSSSPADLSLSASASSEPVLVGGNLVYSIIVSNAGPSAATGVVLSNQLPAGATFVSATGGTTPTNGVLLVSLGSLAEGATNSVQIVVQPAAAGQLTNIFQVFANELDPDLTNNLVTVISTVTNAPAVVTGFPGTPYNTGNWTFTNTASTGGGTDASILFSALIGITAQPFQINFSDDGVGSIRLVHLSPPTNAIPGDIVMLNNPAGGNNPTNWLAVARFFNPNDPTGINGLVATEEQGFFPDTPGLNGFTNFTLLPNVYFLDAESGSDGSQASVVDVEVGPIAGLDPGEVGIITITVSNSVTPVTNADVSLSVNAAPEPVGVGSNLVYSISITNQGPNAASGVTVSNQLPANVTFVSATGGVTPSSGVLLLNVGSLTNGAVTDVQVIVQPTTTGQLTNLFRVFADQPDPVLTNNLVTVISTVTNAPVVARADLSLSASATPQPVIVGSNLVYTVSITNRGPSAATGVTVSNRIPASVTFVSATGGATPTGGVLLVNLGSLATNASTTAQITVQPTAAGNLTNVFQVFADQTDPVLTNNSAMVVSTVTNAALLPVDVALSLTAAPNPVGVGAPLTYSLTVTNNSSTTATGVVVSNTLPPNVTLISVLPSEGSVTNLAGVLTFNVGTLPNGNAATLAIVVVPEAPGLLTNSASAFGAQTDSQPVNNRVQIVTTAVSTPVTNLVVTVLSAITLNPQTGLFEQRIQVSNGGPATPSSVLVLISGLAKNVVVYNASGTTNGLPYVQSASPLGVGSNIVFVLEYYVPTRVMPTNVVLTVVGGPPVTPPVITGTILSISREVVLSNGSVLVQFSAIPGRIYAIQYSSDLATWRTAVPVITAPANQVQWIDAGPPQTSSSPALAGTRYYRVVLLPAK